MRKSETETELQKESKGYENEIAELRHKILDIYNNSSENLSNLINYLDFITSDLIAEIKETYFKYQNRK